MQAFPVARSRGAAPPDSETPSALGQCAPDGGWGVRGQERPTGGFWKTFSFLLSELREVASLWLPSDAVWANGLDGARLDFRSGRVWDSGEQRRRPSERGALDQAGPEGRRISHCLLGELLIFLSALFTRKITAGRDQLWAPRE